MHTNMHKHMHTCAFRHPQEAVKDVNRKLQALRDELSTDMLAQVRSQWSCSR